MEYKSPKRTQAGMKGKGYSEWYAKKQEERRKRQEKLKQQKLEPALAVAGNGRSTVGAR